MIQLLKKSNHLNSFIKDPSAIIGAVLMILFIFCAVFAPMLAPMDPYDLKNIDLANFLFTPAWMDAGNLQFPLGTDDQGRGILSTMLYGLRTSLLVGFSAVAVSIRGSVLEVKENAYITAEKASGARDFRILFKHILPNAMPPIMVLMAVDLAVVIMLEATLSFLGVGVPITEPSLGMMIAIGKNYIYAGMWWMVAFPGVTLILLVVAINLFSDWFRDEMNPKLARRN